MRGGSEASDGLPSNHLRHLLGGDEVALGAGCIGDCDPAAGRNTTALLPLADSPDVLANLSRENVWRRPQVNDVAERLHALGLGHLVLKRKPQIAP